MDPTEFFQELRRLRASARNLAMRGDNITIVSQLIELAAVALDNGTFNNMRQSEAINAIAAEIAKLLAPFTERLNQAHLRRFKQLYNEI